MTALTDHFTLEELEGVGPHTGIDNTPPAGLASNAILLAEKLEQARKIWGVPVRVSYGYRCKALNDAVGSQDTSAHRLFLAVDAIPMGLDLRKAWDMLVADAFFMRDVDQLIIERGCVHIGLAIPAHDNVPRNELRLDVDVNGVRTYPLYGIWTPEGVKKAGNG